jgi:hypothetical protein
MPIQINFLRYSPENDPSFNEKSRKVLMEYLSKRDGLLKKHGIKMLGSWTVPAEHLISLCGGRKLGCHSKIHDGTRVDCNDCLCNMGNESCTQWGRSSKNAKEAKITSQGK